MTTDLQLIGQIVAVDNLEDAARDFSACAFDVEPRKRTAGLDVRRVRLRDSFLLLVEARGDSGSVLAAEVLRHLQRYGEGVLAGVLSDSGLTGRDAASASSPWSELLEVGGARAMHVTPAGDCLTLAVPPTPDLTAGGDPQAPRLYNHIYALGDLAAAHEWTRGLGLEPWAAYQTDLWHLDTLVVQLAGDTYLEFCQPAGDQRPASATISRRLAKHGDCNYMTVLWVDNVPQWQRILEARQIPTLGDPVASPPESPWCPAPELWIHPRRTHGMFIEFLGRPL